MSKLFVDEINPKTTGSIINTSAINSPAVIFKSSPSSAQALPHGTPTILARDTVLTDTNSLSSTNGFTITAATAGYWWVQSVWRTDAWISTRQLSYIFKNGTSINFSELVINSNATGFYPSISCVATLYLNAGDLIQGAAYQQYGTTQNTLADAAGVFNYLEGYRIGG
jgi:hypothetical protein